MRDLPMMWQDMKANRRGSSFAEVERVGEFPDYGAGVSEGPCGGSLGGSLGE